MVEVEITEKINQMIDYLAHEIVVPITGKPSTQYEIDAIEKYTAALGLFARQIIAAYIDAGYRLVEPA